MKEMSKATLRRMHDSNFVTRIFRGSGIDIGGFPDPLSLYLEFFPLVKSVKIWDLNDGDAQFMEGIINESFDFVVSSHCLEHLHDPKQGITNWFRILKPSGYLVVTVPDEDLYEQGTWPSNKNYDHKSTFTIHKENSWSQKSHNILELLISLGESAEIKKVELIDRTHRYNFAKFDQTITPFSESAIELIVRKKTSEELHNLTNQTVDPKLKSPNLNRYLNQYTSDQITLRETSRHKPPFQDESDIN